MEPVTTNVSSKSCPNPIGSNCVTWGGPDIPGLSICKGQSITDLMYKIATLVTSLAGTENSDYQSLLNTLNAALDLSSIDLGCLYLPTTTTYSCGVQTFIPDTTAPNGIGYCATGTPPVITLRVPTPVTVTNPNPRPTTLAGILQLMIDNIPCCDPCNKAQTS